MPRLSFSKVSIDEAICEFRLTPDTPWDVTIAGKLCAKMEQDFPLVQKYSVSEGEIAPVIPESQKLEQLIRTRERVVMLTQDKDMFLVLEPRLFGIVALAPYPGWETFRPQVAKSWEKLCETVEVRGLERIGLRYMTQIELNENIARRDDCFEFRLWVDKSRLPWDIVETTAIAVFSFVDGRDRCRVGLSSVPESAKKLDIDYSLARPRGVAPAKAMEWIDEAHSGVVRVFEGCIAEDARRTFSEVRW